ncbi:HAD family hydrolase [Pseudoramibacter alactolyticus]|jgi:phosphoglycolate phosphatase
MNTFQYRTVLFDLDGTLMDTGPGIFAAFRHVQQGMKWPALTDKQLRALVGSPLIDSYVKTFGLTPEEGRQAAVMHRRFQIQESYRLASPYPGIASFLQNLKDARCKLGVTTLKGEAIARKTLESGHLAHYFDCIHGVQHDGSNPTKAAIIDRALHTLKTQPQEALLIGDSHYDAIGAWETHVTFAAVTYGYGFANYEAAEKYHPLFIARSVSDLSDFVASAADKLRTHHQKEGLH